MEEQSRNRAEVRDDPRPSRMIDDEHYQRILRESFGEEGAAICNLPEPERFAAIARIMALQGDSPRDRAWPTESGHEPAREPGWDPSGTYLPAVVRRVYEELKAAGKLRGNRP